MPVPVVPPGNPPPGVLPTGGKSCLSTWTATTALGTRTLRAALDLFVTNRLASFEFFAMTVVSIVPSSIASNKSTAGRFGSCVSFFIGCFGAATEVATTHTDRHIATKGESARMAGLLKGRTKRTDTVRTRDREEP